VGADASPGSQTGAAPALSAPVLAVLGVLLADISACLLRAPRANRAS